MPALVKPNTSTGYGGVTTVGLTALAIGTSLYDQKKNSEALSRKMDLVKEDFLYNQNMTIEEVAAIDRELSNILSKSEIQALKDEGTLIAMSANTGLSGNITKENIAQATTAKRERDVEIVGKGRQQQTQLLNKIVADEMKFRSTMTALSESALTGTQAGLGTFGAGLSAFKSSLGLLSTQQKTNVLGG